MSGSRESLYQGRALSLNLEQAEYPDGSHGTLEIIRHPGGAGVVALDNGQNVCLIRQFRHAAGGWIWEIPAGRLEHGEQPLVTAQRELAEEAGYQAGEWQDLGIVLPSPGICDERIHLYLARDLQATETGHESGEFIEIHHLPLAEAVAWCRQGRIVDAKTLVALYRCQDSLDTA